MRDNAHGQVVAEQDVVRSVGRAKLPVFGLHLGRPLLTNALFVHVEHAVGDGACEAHPVGDQLYSSVICKHAMTSKTI